MLSELFRNTAFCLSSGLSFLVPLCIFSCSFPVYRVEPEPNGGAGAGAGVGAAGGGTDSGGGQGARGPSADGGDAPGGAGAGGDPMASGSVRVGLSTTPYAVEQDQGGDGTRYVDQCPTDQVVIGFQGTLAAPGESDNPRSLQAICGATAVAHAGQYVVTIAPVSALPPHNAAAETTQTVMCPPNQLVTTFTGRAGAWIDAIDVRCASVNIVGEAPNLVAIIGNDVKVGTLGGESGSVFEPVQCNPNDIGVGQVVRTAEPTAPIVGFGLMCATPLLLDQGGAQ